MPLCNCSRVAFYEEGDGGICIGFPDDPDPPQDLIRICLIGPEKQLEINMTPGEFAKLYEVITQVVIYYFTASMALMERG